MSLVSAIETFTCEKHHCTLTRQACADRQAARVILSRGKSPTYPGCQECEQGIKETKGITGTVNVGHWHWNKRTRKRTEGGINMAFPNKIDNAKLKQMISEGKFSDEIANAMGVHPGSIRNRVKKLGLTPNYRRQSKSAPHQKPCSKETMMAVAKGSAKLRPAEAPAQVIPVILRLTVEVNVRVTAAGA